MSDSQLRLSRRTLLQRSGAALAGVSLLGGAGALLDACGGASSSSGPVSLRWGTLPSAAEEGNAKAFIDAFTKTHPNIKVTTEQLTGDYHQKATLEASSGTLPDIFWLEDQSVPPFAAKNIMLDLTPYMAKGGLNTADIYPSMLNLGKYKGKQYMLPRDYNKHVIFYNVDMFKAAGVPEPQAGWTWDEFVDTARRLTKKDSSGKTIQYGVDSGDFNWWAMEVPAIRGFGGDVIASDGSVIVDSPEAAQGIDALYQLVKEGVAPNFTENASGSPTFPSFATNQCAMISHVRPLVSSFTDALKGKATFNVQEFPKYPVKYQIGCGTSGYCISAQSKHKDEAWALLSFIDSVDGQKAFDATGNSVPVLKSLAQDATWRPASLNNDAFINNADADTLPVEQQLPGPAGAVSDKARNDLTNKLFAGQMSARDFVSQWAQAIKQAIQDAK